MKFLLGLPLTRTDVLIGKIVGRSAGIAVPICTAVGILGLIGIIRFGLFSLRIFLAVVLATILYVAVLVSIATAVSAVISTTIRATGLIVGVVYLGLILLWQPITTFLYNNITKTHLDLFNSPPDGLLFVLHRLSPSGAYHVLTNWALGVGNSASTYRAVLIKRLPEQNTNVLVVEAAFPPDAIPLYLHESLSLVILLLWIVVPVGLARYWFERGDVV